MNDNGASAAFGALSHEARLAIFRLLLREWPASLPAGDIGAQLGIQPSTLSAHLAHLARVGLVHGDRDGRQVRYAADTAGLGDLLRFLTDDCCGGRPEFCHPQILSAGAGLTSAIAAERVHNVLFLCTGNAARSVMAESLLRREGRGRFRVFSAGSQPAGRIDPKALALLQRYSFKTDDLRPKSWDAFAGPDAPAMDFVITLCDQAAAEKCPAWPGQPMSAHWGFPDPKTFRGGAAKIAAAYDDLFKQISTRISIFVNLPLAALDGLALQTRLDEIGRSGMTDSAA